MAKDVNKVILIGRLGKEPEMRYTANQTAVTSFTLATGRSWKAGDGTQQDKTEWHKCVAWDKLAEICNQYLAKGSKVYIEGRIEYRTWEDNDGNTRYTTEIVVNDMTMLDGKRDSDDAAEQPQRTTRPAAPQGKPAPATNGARRNVPRPVDDGSDLPF